MPSDPLPPRPTGRPRWITPFDASRSYLLDDDVDCNIPRRGCVGGFGAHDWARGHLVELYWRLGGTPLSLHYTELLTRLAHEDDPVPKHVPAGLEVTASLRDRHDQLITVVSRRESALHEPHKDLWQLTVNGAVPAGNDDPALDGVHAHPPTDPALPGAARAPAPAPDPVAHSNAMHLSLPDGEVPSTRGPVLTRPALTGAQV